MLNKYFDTKLWKRLQDNFSNVIGVPVTTIDEDGNEVVTSGKAPYFWQLLNLKDVGKQLIRESRSSNFKELEKDDKKYLLYSFNAGLHSLMVPVKFNGKVIASIVVECIVQNVRDYDSCRRLEEKTGVSFEEYKDALNKLQVRNVVEVETFGKMLAVFSNLAAELAAEKYVVDKKINELTILNQIAVMVNSTLEIRKILESVMNFMLQAIKAKSCSILVLDGKKRYSIHDPSKDLLKAEAMILKQVLESKSAVKIPVVENDYRFYEMDVGHNAVLSLPLKLRDDIIGIINLYGDYINLSESDLAFMNIAATQIAVAMDNAKNYAKVKESSIRDKLTGLFNRRHFMDILIKEIDRSSRYKSPLSVALFDVDHFKNYNDTHGHLLGDKLLRDLSEIVTNSVRNVDTLGRYGGEEFIVVMPQTKPQDAKVVIDRLRQNISDKEFQGGEMQPNKSVTVSIGLVTCMNGSLNAEELISNADKNLYKAKNAGRNNVKSSIIVDRHMTPIEVFE
jgi:diguanylate cyclase (GGDEF)-like protein